MSTEDYNVDQVFSDAAQSQKAPQYNSAYWAEMDALLNARDAKKRGFLLWAYGGSALFAVLLLSLFIFNMDLQPSQKQYVQAELTDNMVIDQVNTTEKQMRLSENPIREKTNLTIEETASERTVPPIQNSTTSPKQNTTKHNSNSSKSNTSEKIVKGSNSKESSTMVYAKENSVPNKLTDKSTLAKKRNGSNTNGNDEMLSEQQTVSLPFEQLHKINQDDAGELFKSALKYKPKPRLTIYGKLSGGIMENYKTSRPYESGILNLSLNLEANFNGVLLRTGIGTQLTSNADLIVSKRARVYGFGVTNHQNDLSYQSLLDLYIPLEIGYQINATSFGVGAQVNYLLSTGMDLNHYENHNLVNTERYYGNANGLNSFSTQGYVWLEHYLTPRFSLGVKVGTNISGRIKDDSYFNQSSTTNPIYGQLSLRFNIIQ